MDKSKWEYRKLGEVATFERGLTYSKGDEATISSNGVLRSNNIDLDTHELIFDEIKYLNPNFVIPESKKLKKNSIFICMSNGSKAHLGKVAFADKDYDYAFGGFMGMIVPKNIFPRFLFYYFLSNSYRNGLEQVGKGANINNLRFAQLAEFKVPTPSAEDQQQIVAELDCLNEMIAVKQEQLKEFDKLAQSIFYDMFGDPIENEKGWKPCSLKDVSLTITDGDHMPPPKSDSGVPFVTISNVDKDTRQIDFSSTFFVPRDYYDYIPDSKKPRTGDVLYTVTGSYGIPILIRDNKEFCFQRHIGLIRPNKKIEPIFLCMWAGCQSVKKYADRYATGVAQKTVSLKVLRNFPMIVPPISLQQQFADKISAIEAQKELVKQSIAETQKLLDYTMDKYFG